MSALYIDLLTSFQIKGEAVYLKNSKQELITSIAQTKEHHERFHSETNRMSKFLRVKNMIAVLRQIRRRIELEKSA